MYVNYYFLFQFLILSIASFLAQVATAVVIYVYSLDVSTERYVCGWGHQNII